MKQNSACLPVGLLLLVSFASPVDAQSFAGCGTLINQPFGGCIKLFQPLSSSDVYQLSGLSIANFSTGDVVYLEGDVLTPCATFCNITACLDLVTITACSTPFSECGLLVSGPSCVLFEASSGDRYQLDNLGTFAAGDSVLVDGTLDLACAATCTGVDGCITSNTITTCPGSATQYRRGDTNDDGAINIADAIYLLGHLFPVGSANILDCLDAADANADAAVNIADAITLLAALFGAPTAPLPPPYPVCGTADLLGCNIYTTCP